jgi:hypothetical protein
VKGTEGQTQDSSRSKHQDKAKGKKASLDLDVSNTSSFLKCPADSSHPILCLIDSRQLLPPFEPSQDYTSPHLFRKSKRLRRRTMRKTPVSLLSAILLLAQLVCGFQPVPFLPRRGGGKQQRQRRHQPLRIFPNNNLFPPSSPDQTTAALTLLGSGALLAYGVDSSTFTLFGTVGMGMLIASSIVLREIVADKATIFLPKPKREPSPPKEMPPWEVLTMQADLLEDGSLKQLAAEPLSLPSMEIKEEQAEILEEEDVAAVVKDIVAASPLPPPVEDKVEEPVPAEKEIEVAEAPATVEPEATEKDTVVEDGVVATDVVEEVVEVEEEDEPPVSSSFESGAAIADEFLNAADEEEPLPADSITGIPYVSDSLVDVVEEQLESYEEEDSLIVDPLVLEEDTTDDLLDNPFLYEGGWEEGDEVDEQLVSDAPEEEEEPEASYVEEFASEEEEEEEEPIISGVPYVSDSLVDVVEEGLEIVREEQMSVDPLFYAEEPVVVLGDESVTADTLEEVEEVEAVEKEVETIVPGGRIEKATAEVVEKVEAATIVEDVAVIEEPSEGVDAIVEPELVEDVVEHAAASVEAVIEPEIVEKVSAPPRPDPEPVAKKPIVDAKFDELRTKVQNDATARTKERLKLAVDVAEKATAEMEALEEEAQVQPEPPQEAPPVKAFEEPPQSVLNALSKAALRKGEQIIEQEEARTSDKTDMKFEKQEKKSALRFLKKKRVIVGAAAAIVVARRLIVTILRNGML